MLSITQRVRFTGTALTCRPPTAVGRPVTSATWRSATRASCSRAMRSTGSTLGSLVPSVAMVTASCLALSQLIPPCWPRSLAMSPKNGIPSNGFPSGPSSLMGAA